MDIIPRQKHTIIIIGAGPTGLTLTRHLLDKHFSVILLEESTEGVGGGARDSIFWNKDKLKLGIMRKFLPTLEHPRLRYYGGVKVGKDGQVTLEELAHLAPVVLTCGSRGDRLSQICDTQAAGVFDANELVRTMNQRWLVGRTHGQAHQQHIALPAIGRDIAMVGMGNVIADSIMHMATLCAEDGHPRRVHVLVRRGPFANKIAPGEMKWILPHIDKTLLEGECVRLMSYMMELYPEEFRAAWETNPQMLRGNILAMLKPLHIKENQFDKMPEEPQGLLQVGFHFFTQVEDLITSGVKLVGIKLTGVKIAQKNLDDRVSHREIACDTLIYSVGSCIDAGLDLPLKDGWLEPEPDNAYKVKDTDSIYMAGWSRQPSVGLAGVNVKDAKAAEPFISRDCQPIEDMDEATPLLQEIQARVEDLLVGTQTVEVSTVKQRLEEELDKQQVLSFYEL